MHNGEENLGKLRKNAAYGDSGLDCRWPADAGAAQSTADLYSEKCTACHGDSGKGDGPAGQAMVPPPAPFSTALKGKSDSWIGTVITKGGPAVGMTPAMPPHPSLTSDQVNALIQYIKGLKS